MGEGGEGEGDCAPKNASLSEVVAPAKKLARQLDFTGAPEHPLRSCRNRRSYRWLCCRCSRRRLMRGLGEFVEMIYCLFSVLNF
ncbi:hypothetical protein glysoja_031508 [Glycine soja]|uniref:Uncharacterized protein n=1 Tax=Glycine soja TaxID=3848 RepID=A0A0B2SMZ4_GLYSO|nr:hypothetical protein glysoja_031508 [Glycine soja]